MSFFGLFKKKDKVNQEVDKKSKQNKSKDSKKKDKRINPYLRFGEATDFAKIYMTSQHSVIFAKKDDIQIGISAEKDIKVRNNDVLVINDDSNSKINNLIIPMIENTNMSFLICDQNGKIKHKTEEDLKRRGYDIRTIDMSVPGEQNDRIDIFDLMNVSKNPSECAYILSDYFTDSTEKEIADLLFGAIFEYILSMNVEVTATRIRWVFDQMINNKKDIVMYMQKCPRAAMKLQKGIPGMTREAISNVFDTINAELLPMIEEYCSNPTIYNVLMTKRKTAIFISGYQENCRGLLTAFIYNLITLSSRTDDNELNTVIIDSDASNWYNRELIKEWRYRPGKEIGESISFVYVRGMIPKEYIEDVDDVKNPAIIMYMSSVDGNTIEWVFERCKLKEQMTQEEYDELKSQYGKHDIPAELLEEAPIEKHDIETMFGCLIFTATKNKMLRAKTIRCQALAE